MVESFHRGAAAVTDVQGNLVASFGDVNRPIYPRSAIKPLQALVLAESGALEHYKLGGEEIALACASHSGESYHVESVRKWLQRLGLDESALECGAHYPIHRESRIKMEREGVEATAIHNNCSGKHTGFISVACFSGEPVAGYIQREHPVQQRVLNTLEEVTEESISESPAGLDGCGVPVVGMSLHGVAKGFSRLAAHQFESDKRRDAARVICDAMAKFPHFVGGTGRFCSFVPTATDGQVLIKTGAEGVYAGLALGEKPLGFALKIDDGSRRASEVVMSWLVTKFCSLETNTISRFQSWTQPKVMTVAKQPAGIVRPSLDIEV